MNPSNTVNKARAAETSPVSASALGRAGGRGQTEVGATDTAVAASCLSSGRCGSEGWHPEGPLTAREKL